MAADVVLASGEIIRAEKGNQFSDLFWAVKGAGGNFGVVANFVFKAHPIPQQVSYEFTFHLP